MSERERLDFIRQIVADDVAAGKHGGRVLTRFPPEPNGFLHIGHASAIVLDFGVAMEHGGRTTLRMDDTNPTTEDPAYVEAIARDIAWLGYEWEGEIRYASDYFEALYRLALRMIEDGFAYVDTASEEEIRAHRGTVTEPGRPTPDRDRPIEESLELFRRMRAGEFEDGSHVLRAKIDLASSNMKMRDPLMYRIRHAHHYRTGDEWPIYPLYDWAHGQSDAIEGITHSFCTLEFQDNRELYDWFLDHIRPAAAGVASVPGAEGGGGEALGSWDPRPRQYEFARRNLDYTIVSKRKLLRLVEEGHVEGWDDPRMPTLAAMRRRGIPPQAIRAFCEQVGIGKAENRVDIGTLEWAVRDALNPIAPRVMCVLRPLSVVIENFPEGETEWLDAPYFPRDVDEPPAAWPETRRLPFSRHLSIERRDFHEDPPEGYRRLAPGREVRLRHAYFLRCESVVRDEAGEVVELRCTYDPETRGGSAPDGRRPSGTIHWVSTDHGVPVEVRLYDRLFRAADPTEGVEDFRENLNPDSLEILERARIEPSVVDDAPETHYQFERIGYFRRDRHSRAVGAVLGEDHTEEDERLVFNRTVTLRDSWKRPSAERLPRERTVEEPGEPGEDTGRAERDAAREATPHLRDAFDRLQDAMGLPEDLADLLTESERTLAFYEASLGDGLDPVAVANWLVHEVRGAGGADVEASALEPEALGSLVSLVESGEISRPVAKELLARLIDAGGDPREVVAREGLGRIADEDALRAMVSEVVEAHPDKVERYREGQAGLAGFFVGQVMRATEGRADPALVKDIVRESLE